MIDNDGSPSPLTALVDAFVSCVGQLVLICNHMASYPAPDDADPPPVVLRRLLRDILEPDFANRPAEVATAARVINEVSARIESDLYLVDPDP